MPNRVSNDISVASKSHDFERIRLIKCIDIFIWKSAQLLAQNWDNFVTTLSANTCKSDSCPSLQFTDPFKCQMQCTKVAQKAIRDWLGGLINLFKLQITAKQSCNVFWGRLYASDSYFKRKVCLLRMTKYIQFVPWCLLEITINTFMVPWGNTSRKEQDISTVQSNCSISKYFCTCKV